MKVPIRWLRELVDLNVSVEELITLLPMRTIGLKETTQDFIELDMKGYNRADLLSMRGVAREVASITDSKLKYEEINEYIWEGRNLPEVNIDVENTNLCPIYCVAKIEGLEVEQSSDNWVKALEDVGFRSVNEVVDITNLKMVEYGQPLHAFDASQVKDETIIVRAAKPGEKITTLDGKVRELIPTDLLIADPEKPIGIAGVMGGKNSEVEETPASILLEAAIFNPTSIRKTASRLGLHSEASKRFQHGLTKKNLLQAFSSAIQMYENLGGKLTAITISGDLEDKLKVVQLTQEKANLLIGVNIPAEQVKKYLEKLGFELAGSSPWEVKVPYWRLDINIEEDLVEEVARMYGYENIPPIELKGELPEKIDQSLYELIYKLKSKLADLGLTEVQTYSFYSSKVLNALGFNEKSRKILIKVANPISAETEFMRQNLWPNLVEVIDKNTRQGFDDIAIFEIGKAYNLKGEWGIQEEYRLSIVLMNNTDNPLEELIAIARKLNLGFEFEKSEPKGVEELFHPKRFAALKLTGTQIAEAAEVHLRVLNKMGIEKRVAVLEINIESL